MWGPSQQCDVPTLSSILGWVFLWCSCLSLPFCKEPLTSVPGSSHFASLQCRMFMELFLCLSLPALYEWTEIESPRKKLLNNKEGAYTVVASRNWWSTCDHDFRLLTFHIFMETHCLILRHLMFILLKNYKVFLIFKNKLCFSIKVLF